MSPAFLFAALVSETSSVLDAEHCPGSQVGTG